MDNGADKNEDDENKFPACKKRFRSIPAESSTPQEEEEGEGEGEGGEEEAAGEEEEVEKEEASVERVETVRTTVPVSVSSSVGPTSAPHSTFHWRSKSTRCEPNGTAAFFPSVLGNAAEKEEEEEEEESRGGEEMWCKKDGE